MKITREDMVKVLADLPHKNEYTAGLAIDSLAGVDERFLPLLEKGGYVEGLLVAEVQSRLSTYCGVWASLMEDAPEELLEMIKREMEEGEK